MRNPACSSSGEARTLASFAPCPALTGADELGLYLRSGDALLWLDRAGASQTLLAGIAHIRTIAVDQQRLYWVQCAEDYLPGPLLAMPKQGGERVTLVPAMACGTTLAGDERELYWAAGPSIMRVAKAGGTPATIKRFPPPHAERIQHSHSVVAADAGAIYVELRGDGNPGVLSCTDQSTTWLSVPKDAGPEEELHHVMGMFGGIAVDHDALTFGGSNCDDTQVTIAFSPTPGALWEIGWPATRAADASTIYLIDADKMIIRSLTR